LDPAEGFQQPGRRLSLIPIVVSTHGGLARELVNTAELMLGSQQGLAAVCLEMNEGIEDLIRKLQNILPPQGPDNSGCLLLVDIFGGTPSNVGLVLSRQYPLKVVTGVNLPMVIEALSHRCDLGLEALAEIVREKGQKSILLASDLWGTNPQHAGVC
jgi:PTS system mannose-specific IIA component